MSLLIPPGYAQAVFVHDFFGDSEPMVCTMGIQLATSPDPQGACDDLGAAWGGNVVEDLCANDVALVQTLLYVGQDGGSAEVFESIVGVQEGNNGADSLPPNCALLVRKRTDLAGRRGRGRFYTPGVPRNAVSDAGVVGNTFQGNAQTAVNAFKTAALASADIDNLVVLHRSEGIGLEPSPTVVTQLVVEGKIATQRRRLRP